MASRMRNADKTIKSQVISSEMKLTNKKSFLARNFPKKLPAEVDTVDDPLTTIRKMTGMTMSLTKDLIKVAVAKPMVMPAVVPMIPLLRRKDLKSDI